MASGHCALTSAAMSPEYLGLVMLATLLIVIFVGCPIAFTLIVVSIVFGYVGVGDRVFYLISIQMIGLMKEQILAAVPLFIFMGYVVEQAGLMERLFKAFRDILAPLNGALYLGVILTATVFAMATGIVGAAVTVLGIMAAPIMIKSGYDPRLSAGAITAGGTLGILIPPSVMLVVMGPVLGVSVVKLYAAALGPGFLLAVLYVSYLMLRSYLNPRLGPAVRLEDRLGSVGQLTREFAVGMVPLGALIFCTLGSILAGLATPTEAAALGASGALLLSLLYSQLSWAKLKRAAYSTLQTTSMIMFLAAASTIFGSVFSLLGSASLITNAIAGLPVPPMVTLLLIMALIFILGWPFEWPAIILVFLPIFVPVLIALKFDLVWIGALIAVNLQTSYLSPPVAMSAYYLKAVVPQWQLGTIYRGMAEFMCIQLVALFLLVLFPQIALWFPNWLFR